MTVLAVLQYILSVMIVLSAVYVVLSGNLVRAAFALFFTLFAVAGFYLTLKAELIAGFQILVYVGGILIIILFGIMLTPEYFKIRVFSEPVRIFPAAIISLILFFAVYVVGYEMFYIMNTAEQPYTGTYDIGVMLLSNYILPFEAASLVLLVVLIGAAVLSRREVK
ncbi:MAG TPA: NADH-quinone oxidoreductase subunit J [bacterium]